MAIKANLPLLFFLSFFLLCATLSLAYETRDPEQELRDCKQQCQHHQSYQEQQRCEQRCEDRYREKQRGGGGSNPQDPQQQYQQCQRRCQQQERGQQQQQQCEQRCEEQYREQQREQGRGGGGSNPHDPQREFQECQRRCQQQQRGQQQRQQCEQRCEEQYSEQQREQGRGGGGSNPHDPQREFQECQRRCQQQQRGQQQRQQCEQRCEEQYREQQRERGHGGNPQWEGQQQQENNPYFYDQQSFKTLIRTQEGNVRVLERFSKRSELLRGIENYRVLVLEANPNTFIVPKHCDAEEVFFVAKGRGAITLVREDNRETHNLQCGDVMRVPAGTTVYLINRDNNEKLCIVKLIQPVSTPGRFKSFYGPGGEDPESFYRTFSDEILEAAFSTPRDKLQRLFGQQRKGAIVKASQEQIRAMSRHASSEGGRWPIVAGESSGPYNLFNKRPLHSNNFGQYFQASPDNYKQLQDVDVTVGFANISRGAMLGPYYNSRATKVAMVVEGNGYFEMACPHVASSGGHQGREEGEQQGRQEGAGPQHQGRGIHYQKITAHLSKGDVFIAPAGHPIATVASGNQNLQVVCFDIHAQNNEKHPLAGKNNIMKQLEREAKELSFNIPAKEVEEMLNNQKEAFFFPGPHQRQGQGGRAYA